MIHDPYQTTSEKSTHAALIVRDHYILTQFDKEIFTLRYTLQYIKHWWGEYVFHMIWLNQPFSKSRPTARVFLPFLRNRQITKEAFQIFESNRKLVKGHLMNVLSYLCKDVWSFQRFLFQAHYTSPSKFLSHNNSYQIPAHTPVLHNEESRGYTSWEEKEHCCICILLFKSLEFKSFLIRKLIKKCLMFTPRLHFIWSKMHSN